MTAFENYDPEAERAQIRREERARAREEMNAWKASEKRLNEENIKAERERVRRDFNLSQSRWERFRSAVFFTLGAAVVAGLIWWVADAMIASARNADARNAERFAWDYQCEAVQRGKSVLVDDSYFVCLVDGKVTMTRPL